jgi:hypothetical protein
MRKTRVLLLVLVSASTAAAPALAQSDDAACHDRAQATAAPSANQEFCFTGEIVRDALVRPDESLTRVLHRMPPISLLRIRTHFVPEMLKTVENL